MMKTLKKLGVERIYLYTLSTMYGKSAAYIIVNGKKPNAFPSWSGTRQQCPPSSVLFNTEWKT
jgi:hypothetical protein